jgi:hypothetical protein
MAVVVAPPCRAIALSAALRLDIHDVEMELNGQDSYGPDFRHILCFLIM